MSEKTKSMKRTLRTTSILLLAVFLLNTAAKAQDSEFSPGLGLGLKASTIGIGADLVYNFSPKFAFRLGFERLGYSTSILFEEQGISYDADISFRAGSISLLADFYLGKYVFLSAGAGYNLLRLQFDGEAAGPFPFGDIEIPKEMIGDFSMQLDPSFKVSPYVGIGFGRTIAYDSRIGFAFEVGTFYQGVPNLTIESTGLLSPTSNPDHGQEETLENQIRQYTMYPVLKLSLSYKIISF